MTGEQSELNEILDLSLIADVLQILNFWLNLKQVSSDALMQELKNQDSSYLDCWDSSSIVELSYLPRHIFATTSPQQILHFVLL